MFARTAKLFPFWDDYIWSSGHGDGNNRKKKQSCWWCAACGGQYDWRLPNRKMVVQVGANAIEANVFRAHAAPQGLFFDILINALKLQANQLKDGYSPIRSIVTGLHERSRRGIMVGLRSFFAVDNRSAVDVEACAAAPDLSM